MWLCIMWLCISCDCVYHVTVYHVTVYHVTTVHREIFTVKRIHVLNFRIKIFIARWFRNVACFHIFCLHVSFSWTDENILMVKTSRSTVCVSVTVYHVTLCIMWLCVSCDCVSCDCMYHVTVCIMWLRRSGHFHDKNNNFHIKIFYRSPVPQCGMYTYILFSRVSFSSLLWTHENILMVKTSWSAVYVSCDCAISYHHTGRPTRTLIKFLEDLNKQTVAWIVVMYTDVHIN